jgi:hypothetical protein
MVVLVGTLAVVAFVLLAVADRTSDTLGDPVADATPAAETPPSPSPPATPGLSASPTVTPPADALADPTEETPTVTPDPSPAAGDVPVDVVNQTVVDGLAGRAAEALSSVGWTTGRIDNAALGTPSTTVYVPPGLDDQAALLLDGFPALTRTRPAFEGLALDALTLVLAEPDASSVVEQMEQRATGDVPIASQSAP